MVEAQCPATRVGAIQSRDDQGLARCPDPISALDMGAVMTGGCSSIRKLTVWFCAVGSSPRKSAPRKGRRPCAGHRGTGRARRGVPPPHHLGLLAGIHARLGDPCCNPAAHPAASPAVHRAWSG